MSNSQLKDINSKLNSIETAIKRLSINAQTNDKKPRNCTDTGLLHKAKLLYYQNVKGSDEVMKLVKQRHNNIDKVDFKNWRSVKEITDGLFDKLSSSKKQEYMDKAKMAKNVDSC